MNSRFFEYKLALQNLKRNPRRSISTGIAMVAAFAGLSTLAGHIFNIEYAAKIPLIYGNAAGHLVIYKKNGLDLFEQKPRQYIIDKKLIIELEQIIKKIDPYLENKSYSISAQGLLSTGTKSIPIVVKGIDPKLDEYSRFHPKVKKHAPEFVSLQSDHSFSDAYFKNKESISISHGVSELLGFKNNLNTLSVPEKEVVMAGRSLTGDLNAVNAMISVHHSTGTPFVEDTSVLAPIELVQNLLQTDGISHLSLYLKNDSDLKTVLKILQDSIVEKKLDLEVHPFTDDRIGLFYNGTMSFLYMMGTFFALLILSAAGLVVVNSMTISLMERSKEIGTLMAIGFNENKIMRLFLKESIWLALIASLAGVFFSEVISYFVNRSGWTIESAGTTYSVLLKIMTYWWFYVLLTGVLILVSILSTYFLIKNKTKKQVIELLIDTGAAS